MASQAPRALVAVALCAVAASTACTRPSDGDRRATATPIGGSTYGAAMADVGRRFELLGRAAASGRHALARYELDEIGEVFDETLPSASPPKEGDASALGASARKFAEHDVPALRAALDARDATAFEREFARVAESCNACHRSSGHGFIEVPTAAGRSVPDTEPLAR